MSRHPETERDDVVELLHGREVADPYRWLEDVDSERTQAWVARQREYADEVLQALPERPFFAEVMTAVTHRPWVSAPWSRGGKYFRNRHDGRQKQAVVEVADSLDELLEAPRVLVDPNTWTEDGSASIRTLTVNHDATLVAVGRSDAGSDWTQVQVVDLEGRPAEDLVTVTKFLSPTWLPDGRSFLYNAFDDAGRADGTESQALPAARVMVHTVGESADDDREIWNFADEPQARGWFSVSDDDAWLVCHVSVGTERTNRVWLFPLTTEAGRTVVGEKVDLVAEANHAWTWVGSVDGELLFETDLQAQRGRIVALRPEGGAPREVVGELDGTISRAERTASTIVLETLEDAQPVLRRFSLSGDDLGRLDLSGGAVTSLAARSTTDELFVGFSTLTEVEVAHRVDAATGETRELPRPEAGWTPPGSTIERHRARSADGTEVPYFLVRAKQAPAGSTRPTLLYGYGGFNIPVLADYRAIWSGWLAAGGVLVIANLRGGGEFGRDWYEAGRRQHKQNVFDDFIAVAEHLVSEGVTTPQQLAIHGKSNGGLLVGAAMTQRPDLFAAVLPHVGVLDAARYHLFTVGAAWISDYGDPDDAAEFERLMGWSPLHNVADGTAYPATLVLTGDHDDRVVPAHSHKFTATLQHAQGGEAPIVTRIESATGHGLADKPPAVLAAEGADLLAFAAHHTGLMPPTEGAVHG